VIGERRSVDSHFSHVRFWHLTDIPTAPALIRYWNNSGQRSILARNGLSANDPKRTWMAVKVCVNLLC
jgi:hypothetical protein